jgi:hypothetical protein
MIDIVLLVLNVAGMLLAVAWLPLGIFFSIPTHYGMVRNFWSRKENNLPYEQIAGLHLLILFALLGPTLGILSIACGAQNGIKPQRAWPSREDWENHTTSRKEVVITGRSGVQLQASSAHK